MTNTTRDSSLLNFDTYFAYLASIIILGVSLTTWTIVDAFSAEQPFGAHPWLVAVFVVWVLGTHAAKGYEINGLHVHPSGTAAMGLILLAEPAIPITTVGIAFIVTRLSKSWRGDPTPANPMFRAFFNLGQAALSAGIAIAVGYSVADLRVSEVDDLGGVAWTIGLLLAIVSYFAANVMFVAVAIRISSGASALSEFSRSLVFGLSLEAFLLLLAPLFIVVGIVGPAMFPVLVFAVGAGYWWVSQLSVTERKSRADAATGLLNNDRFRWEANGRIDAVNPETDCVGLVLLQLEGLTNIAHTFGLEIRDRTLREAGQRISGLVVESDRLGRVDRSEIAVLLSGLRSESDAVSWAKNAVKELQKSIDIDGVPMALNATAGISFLASDGTDATELLHAAGSALRHAQEADQDVATYAPSPDTGLDRMELVSDLADGLDDDQLFLTYQPIVDLATGEICEAEALLRWDHPTHGTVLPSDFIPQAEQTELIVSITQFVINDALAQVRKWHEQGHKISVSVNVSARSLHDLDFPSWVGDALAKAEIEPEFLQIEITENAVLEDVSRSAAIVQELRGLGVEVALDDFGTGYSSLSTLQKVVVDRVKIDRSFVTDLDTDDTAFAIAQAVVGLAKSLGLETTAEGIESLEVLGRIRELGCDRSQGFYHFKPLMPDVLTQCLGSSHTRQRTAEQVDKSAEDLRSAFTLIKPAHERR